MSLGRGALKIESPSLPKHTAAQAMTVAAALVVGVRGPS